MSRTGETLGVDQQEFTIGRGGLKIPQIELRHGYGKFNVADFFRKFWSMNGEYPYDSYNVYGQFKVSSLRPRREIVLPADGSKPLLVVRGEYSPKEIESKELGVTALSKNGTESHQILTVPSVVGQFDEFVGLHSNGDEWHVCMNGRWLDIGTAHLSDFSETRAQSFVAAEAQLDDDVERSLGEIVEILS